MELPTHKELCEALVQLKKTRDEIILEISMMETVILDRHKGNVALAHGFGFTATEVDAAGFPATIIEKPKGMY